jgi:hypothetical protein
MSPQEFLFCGQFNTTFKDKDQRAFIRTHDSQFKVKRQQEHQALSTHRMQKKYDLLHNEDSYVLCSTIFVMNKKINNKRKRFLRYTFPFWVTRYILHYTIAPLPQEERFLEQRVKINLVD